MTSTPTTSNRSGFLNSFERLGNKLPDPIMIFVWLILFLMILSQIGAWAGWSASLPYTGKEAPQWGELKDGVLTYRATSLFNEENIARLLTEMPKTFAGFAPLGLVLAIVLGAAVAEKAGLFSALIRGSLRNAPRVIMTPLVAVIGMVSHHASDAAYVVFIPLAAILYAAVGRHPLVGLAAAFAAVSGGYAGNVTPGQIDVLLFGFTQEAARIVEPGWTMNPVGNWWFILSIVCLFTPIIWFVTDRIIEPRLGTWGKEPDAEIKAELAKSEITDAERKGLRYAGLMALLVVGLFATLTLFPGADAAFLFGADCRIFLPVCQHGPCLWGGRRNCQIQQRCARHDAGRHSFDGALYRLCVFCCPLCGDVQLVAVGADPGD
jgi:aminobenzoyl-glutamate transport protein